MQLPKVNSSNAQSEFYLPDVLPLLQNTGAKVGVEICETFSEIQGINTVAELTTVEAKILDSQE